MPVKPELNQLIASLLLMGFEGQAMDDNPTSQWLAEGLSGVVLFDVDYQHLIAHGERREKNIGTPEELSALTRSIKRQSNSALISIDMEGGNDWITVKGKRERHGVNRLPPNLGYPDTLSAREMGELYEAGNIAAVQVNCEKIAGILASHGINLVFAPVVDVNVNPDCPIIGKMQRSFSDKPKTVIACAELFIEACAKRDIHCVLKHFPGHGSSNSDSHTDFTDITKTWQSETELAPYQALLDKVSAIMTSHVIHQDVDSLPVSVSQPWSERLRGLGFEGVIVTDDIQMTGLAEVVKQRLLTDGHTPSQQDILNHSVLMALKAGADMVIVGNQLTPFEPRCFQACVSFLADRVSAGELAKAQLLASHARVAKLKVNKTKQATVEMATFLDKHRLPLVTQPAGKTKPIKVKIFSN